VKIPKTNQGKPVNHKKKKITTSYRQTTR